MEQTIVYQIFRDCKEDAFNAFQNQRVPKVYPQCVAECVMSGKTTETYDQKMTNGDSIQIGQMRALDGTGCSSGMSHWGTSYVSFGDYDLLSMNSVRRWDHSFTNLKAALDSLTSK